MARLISVLVLLLMLASPTMAQPSRHALCEAYRASEVRAAEVRASEVRVDEERAHLSFGLRDPS